jgi:RNA polymerase sigma-70 factor (ECF subfamily)
MDVQMPSTDQLEQLAGSRERFLAFVRRHVAHEVLAEDILQAALVKAAEGLRSLKDEERLVPWFYTLLRNTITDTYRREARLRTVHLPEDFDLEDEPALERTLCLCFEALLPGLKPEYAEVINLLDIDGEAAASVAERLNITPGNLKVRHHRARQALRRQLEDTCRVCAEHRCWDCTCRAGD